MQAAGQTWFKLSHMSGVCFEMKNTLVELDKLRSEVEYSRWKVKWTIEDWSRMTLLCSLTAVLLTVSETPKDLL